MIRFENVSKVYDDGTRAVDDLSFEVPAGTLLALVGPSGCGKTTSLRMINRLIDATSGSITLDDIDVLSTDRVALRRKIGYVIQHAGLFPHRTVVDNVAALPRLLGGDRRSTRARALELLELVGLDERFAHRYPWQLSGGQQQRVGVARALATDPPYLLMDEPFSAVDPIVRAQLQDEFLRLQQEIGKTIVMVTHDIDEALKLGDHVAVLRTGGVLAQIGTPMELLTSPVDDFVADFIGGARGYRALGFAGLPAGATLATERTARIGEPLRGEDGWTVVVDDAGRPLGWTDARTAPTAEPSALHTASRFLPRTASLRDLLDGALASPAGRVGIVDDAGVLVGSLSAADVVDANARRAA
ncbi:ATP-binding cassette domain-containing protein [Microbacterium sp. MEC084]|uniref:ABC transporter ATP-binding protein n=1 Tax=Microbacterium sp. MEC084 TaxID=1963027 RepID=UPI00106F6E45|nr:ATP-binding cassette domain-containing protein [Microbacterium sp. MEC084]MCD1268012.1 ATP-binding cassette domain-containing protein [Microbacterium sp. MEC084]